MKRIATLLLSICSSVLAMAQMMPDSTVQIVAYWDKGDKFSYDCATAQYVVDADGNKTAEYASSETRTFEVIGADESGYMVRLSYSDVFSPTPVPYFNSDQVRKMAEALTITFKTDEMGTLVGIVDDKESFDGYTSLVSSLLENVWKTNKKELNGLTKTQFIENMKAALCNRESMMVSMVGEFSPLLMFHGCRLDTTSVYSMPQTFTNVMESDKPFQLDTQFWVDQELTDSTFVVLRTSAYGNEEDLAPVVMEHAVKLARLALDSAGVPYEESELIEVAGKSVKEEVISATFHEYTTTQIHMETGWPICWYSTREIAVSTVKGNKKTVVEKSIQLNL